ncbi:MAG: insulinase family protein [Clostridia bacterium]|nr:insulinase family protein [Clostridia bacterium]
MEFQRFTLDNGLRIIGVPMPGIRTASLGLWVDSGSIYETKRQNGISHFIEHMLFKGTYKRSAKQIAQEMDAVGGLLNAFTDVENTCFYTRVLTEHVPLAMDMISDLVLNSRLDPEDIEKEKGVVLEEISMAEDTPDDLVFELLNQAQFPSSRLSRPVLGSARNVKGFTREDITDYMAGRYRPEGAVLAVAGNYDWDAFIGQANSMYGSWQPLGKKRPVFGAPKANPMILRKGKDIEQIHICIGFPGPKTGDKNNYAWSILSSILGGSQSSRLFQSIREERGLAYSVYSSIGSTLPAGMFFLYAGASPNNAGEVVKLLNGEIRLIAEKGVTPQEFEMAKQQTLSQLIMGMELSSARMKLAGRRLLMLNQTLSLEEMSAGFKKVTLDEVNSIAAGLASAPRSAALVGAGVDKVSDGLLKGEAC